MAVGMVLWGAIYQELWGREEKLIAVKWGTSGFEEDEKDRFVCIAAARARVCLYVLVQVFLVLQPLYWCGYFRLEV